eukprot:jgi/Tetstr1/420841/TSEL_011916.t1
MRAAFGFTRGAVQPSHTRWNNNERTYFGWMAILENKCANRVATGVTVGASLGGAIGAVYGTFEAFRYKVPGMYKIRFIGQTTVSSAALFGLFLGAGSLLQCGRAS